MVVNESLLAQRVNRARMLQRNNAINLSAGVSLKQFEQNVDMRLQAFPLEPEVQNYEIAKFSGDWFTPVLRQNWASTTSQSLSRIPLVFDELRGAEKKVSRAELQAKYGDPIGFNFREDMSERRAKLIADDYKQQLRDAEIASNFEGGDWQNKVRFTAPTIIANLPDAAIETAVVWGAGLALSGVTGGASLVGASLLSSARLGARGIGIANKLAKVAKVTDKASKVLLTTSDIYKTGTKGRQVLRSLGHSALIENGVGAITTGFNEIRQGADLKQASQIAGTQLAIGAVATPVMVGLGKLGQEGFKLAGKGINKYMDNLRPEKQLADIASDIGGKVELDNVRLDSDITRTTNLGRSLATLEEMYTPDRLEDIGGLIDVVNRTDGVELDFSKPIIRGMDETLGDVVDEMSISPYDKWKQSFLEQNMKESVLLAETDFRLKNDIMQALEKQLEIDEANVLEHKAIEAELAQDLESAPKSPTKKTPTPLTPRQKQFQTKITDAQLDKKIKREIDNLEKTTLTTDRVVKKGGETYDFVTGERIQLEDKVVTQISGIKKLKAKKINLLEDIISTRQSLPSIDQVKAWAEKIGIDANNAKLKKILDKTQTKLTSATEGLKKAVSPKAYDSLIDVGYEAGNKTNDIYVLAEIIEDVSSLFGNQEKAIRRFIQGLSENDKISDDVLADIQSLYNISGGKRSTVERIMDAPFTESELKGVGLQKRGEEIGELATSEAEFRQTIDVIASNHPDPTKAKKKLLLGASKTFDAESVNIEKVTTELEADDAFYGEIVKEDPLGNVILEAPEPLAIKVDEPATDFYVKQAERLDGLHGATEQRVAFKEAVDELNAMTRDVDEFANRPPTHGNKVKAFDNDGTVYNLAYRVVEMDDLIPSNTKDLKPNPNYPSELQPRDRTREASRDQINSIAQKLVPEKLAESPNISDGSPIVGEDLVVESGNGRTLALQKAYDSIPKKATAYKDFLVSNAGNYGIDAGAIEGMKQPVLVRVNQNNVDRVAFTKKANESTLASMSIIEQAKSDASKLDENILRSLKPDESGDFNAGFVKRFINEIVPDSERGMLLTADAELNNLGLKRIENAIVAKAIDVPDAQKAIANMLDSAEPEMRNMGKAILNTAPIMISTKQMIADGIRKPLDISGDIAVTVSKLLEIKSKKLNVEKYYAQGALFDDGLTLTQNYLMQIFEKYNRSPKNLEALIKGVYDAIDEQGDPRQASLFALEEKTTADIVKDVYNKMEQDIQNKKNQSLQEEGLFDVKEYKNKIQPLVERGLDTPYKAIEAEVPRLEPEPPSKKLEPSVKASLATGLSDFSYDNPTLIDDMYKQYMENGEDVSILGDAIQQFKQTQGDVDALIELVGNPEKFEKFKEALQCKGMNL